MTLLVVVRGYEMSLVLFNVDDSPSDSLPWVNEYIDNGGEPNNASRVLQIKKTGKGFIVITREFKGFAFAGSKLHSDLESAIPVWKQQRSLPFAIFAVALENGKIAVGTDTDFECAVKIDKKGNIDFKYSDTQLQSDQTDSNPFLIGLITPPTSGLVENERKRSGTSPKISPL